MPQMQHSFTLLAGRSPEADAVVAQAGRWLRQRMDRPNRSAQRTDRLPQNVGS
jgi:hypothetical protein